MWAEAMIVGLGEETIGSVGAIGPEQGSEPGRVVGGSGKAADGGAGLLDEAEGCIEQRLPEGDQYWPYSLRLSGGVVLTQG
jgi:hypothetical protein